MKIPSLFVEARYLVLLISEADDLLIEGVTP